MQYRHYIDEKGDLVSEPVVPVYPTVEELLALATQIDAVHDALRAGRNIGGTADEWYAIDNLRSASIHITSAAARIDRHNKKTGNPDKKEG